MDQDLAFNRNREGNEEDEEPYNSVKTRQSRSILLSAALSSQLAYLYRTPARSKSALSDQSY